MKPKKKLTNKQIAELFMAQITAHDSHNRKQVGPCVYCADCNLRLYQGKL